MRAKSTMQRTFETLEWHSASADNGDNVRSMVVDRRPQACPSAGWFGEGFETMKWCNLVDI